MRFITTILLTGAVASQIGATDCGNVLRDSGFDLWCGDQLCAWKIERGNVNRVSTWNEGDPGVELVGDDVAIEQLAPVDSSDGTCLEFDLIANIDPSADVELNVDVLGDGTIEHTERLPASNWKPLSYQILVARPYAGIRFEITKRGVGHAALANIGAKITTGCAGLPALTESQRPLGTPCQTSADCASGICGTNEIPPPFSLSLPMPPVCLGCDLDHPCTAGDVCGVGDPVSPLRAAPTACMPAASRALGEQCGIDSECASGHCTYTTCSTCGDAGGCASGETCGPAWDVPYGVTSAWTCNANQAARQHGEPCASDFDCASGTCVGAERKQCPDGRGCVTSAECPFHDLQNGACTTVASLPRAGDGPESARAIGIQGGSCQ